MLVGLVLFSEDQALWEQISNPLDADQDGMTDDNEMGVLSAAAA